MQLCMTFVLTSTIDQVPFSMVNSLMERSLQKDKTAHSTAGQLNMVFYMVWFNLAQFIFTLPFFWLDVLPGFGTMPSITAFLQRYKIFYFIFVLIHNLTACILNVNILTCLWVKFNIFYFAQKEPISSSVIRTFSPINHNGKF